MEAVPALLPVLNRIPNEVFQDIISYLPNSDIKNLRLVCRFFRNKVSSQLERVFLSANPLNIQVLRNIADHDIFRHGVVEIIWDDARLERPSRTGDDGDDDHDDDDDDEEGLGHGCPGWFARECKENVAYLKRRRRYDVDRSDHIARAKLLEAKLPLRESFTYFEELIRQQEQVIASDADAQAFCYALKRFPRLRRITITPAAHGFLFTPLYATPMIRAFPYGFNYPIPRSWPGRGRKVVAEPVVQPWVDEEEKEKWRGFRIATRVLAQEEPRPGHAAVTEFVVDVNQLNTGLNCRIFDEPCDEYNHLVTLLRRPGFSRIDLPFIVGGLEWDDWPSFRSGYLFRALAEASDLEHVSLGTNVVPDPDAYATEPGSAGFAAHFIPLRTIFPVEKWPRLRHLGLSRFLVKQKDVLALLASLPDTLRSVELSFLMFLDGGGSFRGLLDDMRDTLGWRERPVAHRPRVIVGMPSQQAVEGRAVWADHEVEAFLNEQVEEAHADVAEKDHDDEYHRLEKRVPGTATRSPKPISICDDDEPFQVQVRGNHRYPSFPAHADYPWDTIEGGRWDSIPRYWGNASADCSNWQVAKLQPADTLLPPGSSTRIRAKYQTEHVFEGQLIGDFFTQWLDKGRIIGQDPIPQNPTPRVPCAFTDFWILTWDQSAPWIDPVHGDVVTFGELMAMQLGSIKNLDRLTIFKARPNQMKGKMFTGHQPVRARAYKDNMSPDEQLQATKEMGMVFTYLNQQSVWDAFCATYEAIYELLDDFDVWYSQNGQGIAIPPLQDEWKEYIEVVLRSLVRRSRATFDYFYTTAMAEYDKALYSLESDPLGNGDYISHWVENRLNNKQLIRISGTCQNLDAISA
ncbi:hypothetical protein SODALDRAFT_312748 [Sodiomyces alkalinus F11]|uniref:F-box domain-containing protein n=1 Tax=Sodiomyces alkalinus (strain CBS 110278 / VKM F-3762 / F11) TaxID=1314773 RepID=A0A3N2PUL4_SODAK|nr:hypothetical protein SODALDRAFT_312748 [Sodiomyces alkalinus F11]ROT38193.1 hypothetical protein SODALDRAFT_312748 [Sodiomyces alkalinus F11]